MFQARDKSAKKPSLLKAETLTLFQNNHEFFACTFLSVQFKFSVHSCINFVAKFLSKNIYVYLLLPLK